LESRKLLFLLTVKVLIRVQEGSSVFLFLSSNHNGAAKFALYALHCTSLPQMCPYFSANGQLDTNTEKEMVQKNNHTTNGKPQASFQPHSYFSSISNISN